MDDKIRKIETLAFHKDTGEAEAIAAFLKLRKLMQEAQSSTRDTPSNSPKLSLTVKALPTTILWAFLDEVFDFSEENNVHVRIKSSKEGIPPDMVKSIRISSMVIHIYGNRQNVDAMKKDLENLIIRANETLKNH